MLYIYNMKKQNLGYACINMQLREQNIFAGRTCRKATFQEKGLDYVGELGLQNVRDLYQIVQWNSRNDIKLYRIGSDIFPWQSEYKLEQLPQYSKILNILKAIGDFVKKDGQRLSFHPGPFNILGSTKPEVVERTIIDLQNHSEIFDLMGFEPSPYNKINIHIGATYGDKDGTVDRWITNFNCLNESTKKRITIENDDKESMYSVADLQYVHERTGVPIVFDYHHHSCYPDGMSHKTALEWAIETWPEGITPVVHYSSCRKLHEDITAKVQAHADYIYEDIDTYGYDVDIMLECKQKEKALLQYRKRQSILMETI